MPNDGISITPEPAVSRTQAVPPTVIQGGIVITPDVATARATAIPPEVVISPYELSLLSKAQKMHDQHEYGLAVIAAHMACEIAATQAFSRALKSQGLAKLDDPISDFFNGFNLANERNRNLFNAVTNLEIHKRPFWDGFKNSAKVRNEIVHSIRMVHEEESSASLIATTALVNFLLVQG